MHDLRHTTSKLTNAGGLCLSIVGGVFGSILAIEFVQLNRKYDSFKRHTGFERVLSYYVSAGHTNNYFEKRFPYSLVIISEGLLLLAISIIRHINLRKTPNIGTILSEPVNDPTIEELELIVSSTPLTKMT
ncbi:uncharacterized protein LOC134681640 [Mytilus trossulus]|uniref:uncharacterized protein LOC134681640 n=1 Tax=Mytilus trossulus TaxID=6551 RepID=UPI0030044B1A